MKSRIVQADINQLINHPNRLLRLQLRMVLTIVELESGHSLP